MNLRKLVAETLESSAALTPSDLAAEVAAQIPARKVREVLAEALTPYVHQVIQHNRSLPADHTQRESQSQVVGGNPSSKVAAIRDWSRAQLRQRYHVGRGEWKFLGDFTFEDCMFAAQERREMAARNAAKAELFEALAERMKTAGAGTVSDLPVDELPEMGHAA
jgi:hypothetical protein